MGGFEKLEKRIAGAWIDQDTGEDNLIELAGQIFEYIEGQGFALDEQEALKEQGLYMLADICQSIKEEERRQKIAEDIGIFGSKQHIDYRIHRYNFGPN